MIVSGWFYREHYLRGVQRTLQYETQTMTRQLEQIRQETEAITLRYNELQGLLEQYQNQHQNTRRSATERINALNSTIAGLIELNDQLTQKLAELQTEITQTDQPPNNPNTSQAALTPNPQPTTPAPTP